MKYYQALPVRKVPQVYLTYAYHSELTRGKLVDINIRGKLEQAVIIGEVSESQLKFDKSKIKLVSNIYNYNISENSLIFLKLFSQNTFNSINLSLSCFLRPLKLITQKQWKSLSEFKYEQKNKNSGYSPIENTQFLLDRYITLR
ncbi:MAG: hypothetical protein AAGF07_04900, partial [Patescibacteria group bacterium]